MADLKISQLTGATTPLAGTEVLPVVQSSSTKKVSVANLTAGRAVSVGSLASAGSVQIGTSGPYAVGTVYADANWGMLFTTATSAPANSDYGWLNYAGATLAKINSNNFVLESGNFVPNTAAKGVNFTANTPAAGMTSQLLNWYEEGTWTGTLTSATPPTTPITATGRYTRIGRLVTATVGFNNVDNTGAAGQIKVSGLPFTSNGSAYAIGQMYMSRAGTGPLILDLGPSATEMTTVDSAGNGVSWVSTGPGIYGRVQITYQV